LNLLVDQMPSVQSLRSRWSADRSCDEWSFVRNPDEQGIRV